MKKKKILFYLCFFLYQLSIMFRLYINRYWSTTSGFLWSCIFILSAVFLILISFLPLIKEIYKDARLEAELQLLQQQNELKNRQSLVIQKKKQDVSDFHQTITGQLTYLRSCLRKKDYPKARSYYQQISRNFQEIRFRPCCSDSLISAVLDAKREIAESCEIQVDYQLVLPSGIPSFSPAVNGILFNLLDNAIESCTRVKGAPAFIQLTSRTAGDFWILHMINSKPKEDIFSRRTSKKDTLAHGFGLSIIEEITESKDGSCQWEDKGTTFESTIMLRILN